MKKTMIIPAVFAVGFLVIGLSFFFASGKDAALEYPVCFGGNCYMSELAATPQERERGLMFRESLADGKGMFFVFDEDGKHDFWMKNTLIPLDIVWMGEGGEVSHIAENVQPCRSDPCPLFVPPTVARYVLEINAGEARRIGLKAGDKAVLPRIEAR